MSPKKTPSKEKNLLKCEHCDYYTPRKAFMDDHVRIHTGDRPYRCDECGKGFTQKSNLTKHQIVHGAGYKTEYKCDKCDFVTRYKQSLKMHENWHNGVKPYACKVCDRTFSQSTHRRTHMKEAHGDERKYQCHMCSKCFKRKEHLDKHIAFHKNERNYACDVCGKKFIEEKHVTIHKLIHGGEETKKHQCDLCPYKSRYKQGLQVHYRIHLGVRPYKCEQCTKAFRTSQTLRIHKRMVHQGLLGKKFHCGHCEYRSANKQSLKKHIDHIHIGIKKEGKQFPCPYCGNIYQSHASLHGHKRKKHPAKLRQEMQTKLQVRLSMIRCSEQQSSNPKFDANLAVADYRFKNPLHQSLKETLLKKVAKSQMSINKNKKKVRSKQPDSYNTAKEPDNIKTSKSPKATIKSSNLAAKSKGIDKVKVSIATQIDKTNKKLVKGSLKIPKKELGSPTKKITESESGSKKKAVHDLLQERIAKKNKQLNTFKPKASKQIDFSTEESHVRIPNESIGEVTTNPKVCYMSGLGLLQRSSNITNDVINENINTQPTVTLGTIHVKLPNEFNQGSKSDSTSSSNKVDYVNKMGKIVNTPKKSTKPFPKIKALKNPKKSPSPKKTIKLKACPKESVPLKSSVKNGNALWHLPVQQCSPSMIVYEPVDVPSLGPYSNQFISPIQMSPEAGSLLPVSDIKEEPHDYSTAVDTQSSSDVPINYSMKEYDSLRALASVYLDKTTE